MADIFEKLNDAKKRFDCINEEVIKPEVMSDQKKYKDLMKELKNLTPIIECYKKYEKEKNDFKEAKEILKDGGLDKDFKEMVKQQLEDSEKKLEEISKERFKTGFQSKISPLRPLKPSELGVDQSS